jgi:hypothetical protein
MGKQSKLRPASDASGAMGMRNHVNGSRYSYGNGDRKLYDRDKKPEGLDDDIWSLTLYFDQVAEENGCSTPGRHIVYTELYHRVSKDPDLSPVLDVSSNSAYCGIAGVGILEVLEQMILLYWTDIAVVNDSYINKFCSTEIFTYLKNTVVEDKKRQLLLADGIRKSQVEREIRPSRKTEEEKEIAVIKHKKYSEEELADKFRRFREG